MNPQWWKQYLELDLLGSEIVATVEARSWGYFVHNRANRDHYDANTARWRTQGLTDDGLEEVVALYHGSGLDARLRLPDAREPAPLAAQLEAKGFESDIMPMRLMHWDYRAASSPDLPRDVVLRRGTLEEADRLADIGLAANQWPGRDWFVCSLQYLLASPVGRLYIAEVDGEPAAMAALIQGEEAALIENVATHPTFRRRGLAAALIRQIQSEATTPLILTVEDDGPQRIYQRAGFEVTGEIQEVEGHFPVER